MSPRKSHTADAADRPFGRHPGLKALLPALIGLAVAAWMMYDDFSAATLRSVRFDAHVWGCLALALVAVAGREGGMTWRFRAMTDRALRWGACLRVCMLCEFTSAITPSTVGGSALGMVFLHKEGLPLGRATSLMMVTILLDELFFVIAAPVAVWAVSDRELFGFGEGAFSIGLQTAFWLIYAGIAAWAAILLVGIVLRPQAVKRALTALFSIKPLRRWRASVEEMTDNMVTTGAEIRHKSPRWWGEAMAATALSWMSRFLVVNALFAAFIPAASQAVVLGRQIVVWLVLTVSPTPGGSGVSEWLFTEYYGDLIGSAALALVIALCWRVLTFYLYLAVGAVAVPRWVNRAFGNRKKNPNTTS